MQTPGKVVEVIMQGFSDRISSTAPPSRAIIYGSVYGPDIVLTAAYYEQVNEIGWFHFCLGCLSTKWSTAVQMYSKAAGTMVDSTRWASLAIQVTWQYMKTLQKYRNELVHGSTVEEEVEKNLQDLHKHVCHHYACFEQNNNYVLHAHLFTQKSDQHRLQMSWMKHYLFCVLKRIIYVKLRASFPPPYFHCWAMRTPRHLMTPPTPPTLPPINLTSLTMILQPHSP